jgi:very-short-patch-repair endonuclease
MNRDQQQGKRTTPEKIGYALLDALGADYLPQYLIAGKFCVDAFVPSRGVVVQFDGDYWHGNPARFPTLDARQRKRVRLDRSQDAYMAKCGYHVIRLWESDLRKDPGAVRTRLRPFVVPLKPKPASPG